MHSAEITQRRHLRARSSARPCKRQASSGDPPKHSKQQDYTDCCSQPDSSVSASSNVQMQSSRDEGSHLESSLQCEEHQCLSSPQDSDTSAQSCQAFCGNSPVPAVRQHLLQRPSISFVPTGPSLAEVPTYALGETHCIANHCGKSQNLPFASHSSHVAVLPATLCILLVQCLVC